MNLTEAFKALESLNEEVFDMSDDGVQQLSDFMEDDIVDDDIKVIDPEATTEDELSDNYVGKVILDCGVCHSKIYKDKEEVTLDDEGVLANVGEECPYCYTSDGFKVVGEIAPFGEEDADKDEIPANDETPTDGEELPESKDDKLEEGIFDKKNSAEMNNAGREYERKVKEITGTSLNQMALNIAKKIREAASEYKTGFDDENRDADNVSKERILTSKSKQILAGYEELIKLFKKPNNFSQSASAVSRLVKKILEDYASDASSILDELTEYSNALIQVGKIDADKKLVKEQFKQFYKTLVRSLQSELDAVKKKPLHTLFRESYSRNKPKGVNESIDELSMTANDTHFEVSEDESGTVTVTASPVTTDGGEQIAPISAETEEEIVSASDEGEIEDDGETIDIEIDEVDEESIDELGESYLTEVYHNVKSFKTSSVSTCGNKFIVEGRITFKSGKTGKTSFILESHSADKTGRVSFVGGNKHFSNSNRAYTLNGRVSNNKFIAESFRYNYRTQDKVGVKGKVTKRVK